MNDLTQLLFDGKQVYLPRYTLEQRRLRERLNAMHTKLLIVSFCPNIEDKEACMADAEVFERLASRLPQPAQPVYVYYTDLKQLDISIFFTCANLRTVLFCGVVPFMKSVVINKAEHVTIFTKNFLFHDDIGTIDKDPNTKKLMWNQLLAGFK